MTGRPGRRARGVHRIADRGFSRAAGAYERGRPDYPASAARFVARAFHIGPGSTVIDLAAGTGKWTRGLVGTGARILAVEPLPAMRREFRRAVPGVRVVAGTAERTGLPDGCADLVTVAQAFHWFDHERALLEIRRLLRPGGGLAILWNVREHRKGWRREILKVSQRYENRSVPRRGWEKWRRAFRPGSGFTPLRLRTFHHEQWLTRRLLEDRFLSLSYIAALPGERKAEFLDRFRQVLETHPGARGRRKLMTPYTTEVYYALRQEPRPGGEAGARGRSRRPPSPRSGPRRGHTLEV